MGKIFGIGLSRTGTTSLTEALSILGYSTYHFPSTEEEIDSHDCSTDTSIAVKYKELDRKYPDSLFILTERDIPSWLMSCEKFWAASCFDEFANYTHDLLYGRRDFDLYDFHNVYCYHVMGVINYFGLYSKRLLLMNICGGGGWEVLCPFLGKEIPDRNFPRSNIGVYNG